MLFLGLCKFFCDFFLKKFLFFGDQGVKLGDFFCGSLWRGRWNHPLAGGVSKKALVSAAGSILPFFFGTALARSTWDHLIGYPRLKYTLIPYCMTLDELADPYNFSSVIETPWEYGLYFGTAVVVILVHIAVLTAVCYVVFNKQQTKQ